MTDESHVYTPPQYQKHHQDSALEIAQWRLETIRQALDKFLDLNYNKAKVTDDKRVATAFFTLGEITGMITMSDDAVVKRMQEKNNGV